MNKNKNNIIEGLKFGFGIILIFSLLGVVYAGYHGANQILAGTFIGDFIFQDNVSFQGNVNLENAIVTGVDNGNYSYTEVKTGKTWVNGKPIYRKVLVLSSNPIADNTWRTITYTDYPVNVEDIVSAYLQGNRISGYSFQQDANWAFRYMINPNGIGYLFGSSTTKSIASGDLVVLEYTKTTD